MATITNEDPLKVLDEEIQEKEDVEKLTLELKAQQNTKEQLQSDVTALNKTLDSLLAQTIGQKLIDKNNVWYERFLYQKDRNLKLQKELQKLTRQMKLLEAGADNSMRSGGGGNEDRFTEIELRQLFRKLLREKAILDWELHSEEWRLNREAKDLQRANDMIIETTTRLNDMTQRLNDTPLSLNESTVNPLLDQIHRKPHKV